MGRVGQGYRFPEIVIPKILSSMQHFKRQSLKECSHNLILSIDKMITFAIFDSTILMKFHYTDYFEDFRLDPRHPHLRAITNELDETALSRKSSPSRKP
jgi:hypothetical protein